MEKLPVLLILGRTEIHFSMYFSLICAGTHHQQSLFYGSNQESAIDVVQRTLMQQDYGECNTVVKECNFLDLQNLNLIKLMTALDSCDQIPANASPCNC